MLKSAQWFLDAKPREPLQSVGQEALLHKPREIKPFFKISGNKIFSLKCDFIVTTYFTKSLKKKVSVIY